MSTATTATSATTTTTTSLKRRTGARPAAAVPQTVDARSYSELLERDAGDDADYGGAKYVRLTGRHMRATWRELTFNFLMEMIGVFVLSTAVQLVAFQAGPTQNVPSGAALALVYALAYYVACCMPRDFKLKAHCNPAISIAYMGVGDIGILGFVFYLLAGSVGAFASGGAVNAILSEQLAQVAGACFGGTCVARATVPLPITTSATSFGVSRTTVICMEIFMPAIIAFFLVVSEYLNTKSDRKLSNYYRSVRNTALLTGALVALGYPFQMWSFNSYIYLGGLISGANAPSNERSIFTLAALPGTKIIDSVWGAGGDSAWALYFFGVFAGGVAAIILTRILMMFGFLASTTDATSYRSEGPKGRLINAEMQEPLLLHQAARVAMPATTELKDLVNPFVTGPSK